MDYYILGADEVSLPFMQARPVTSRVGVGVFTPGGLAYLLAPTEPEGQLKEPSSWPSIRSMCTFVERARTGDGLRSYA